MCSLTIQTKLTNMLPQTYWQTETGSNVITPLAGISPTKPGSASFPFFGIEPAIIDPVSGEECHGNDVEGVLAFKQPWPSMTRTVYGAHERYMDTYLNVYKGYYVCFPQLYYVASPLPTSLGDFHLSAFLSSSSGPSC